MRLVTSLRKGSKQIELMRQLCIDNFQVKNCLVLLIMMLRLLLSAKRRSHKFLHGSNTKYSLFRLFVEENLFAKRVLGLVPIPANWLPVIRHGGVRDRVRTNIN